MSTTWLNGIGFAVHKCFQDGHEHTIGSTKQFIEFFTANSKYRPGRKRINILFWFCSSSAYLDAWNFWYLFFKEGHKDTWEVRTSKIKSKNEPVVQHFFVAEHLNTLAFQSCIYFFPAIFFCSVQFLNSYLLIQGYYGMAYGNMSSL